MKPRIIAKNNYMAGSGNFISVPHNYDGSAELQGNMVKGSGSFLKVRSQSEDFAELVKTFPVLVGVPLDVIKEEVYSLRGFGSNDTEVVSAKIKTSKLGEWLSKQAFVDWAALAAALIGLIPN